MGSTQKNFPVDFANVEVILDFNKSSLGGELRTAACSGGGGGSDSNLAKAIETITIHQLHDEVSP